MHLIKSGPLQSRRDAQAHFVKRLEASSTLQSRRDGQAHFVKRLEASSTLALFVLFAAVVRADPPEEIRIGLLGDEGIVFREEGSNLEFCETLAGAGDVNGDGLSDILLVVEDTAPEKERTVYLVYGASDLPPLVSVSDLDDLATRITRGAPRFQGSDIVRGVAPAGDLDADGFDDFFILRPYSAPEGWADSEVTPGVVDLIYGASSLPREIDLAALPDGVRSATLTSTNPARTSLALSIATGGDYNGDGFEDLAFGAGFARSLDPPSEKTVGRIYVLFGPFTSEGLVDVEAVTRRRPGFVIEGSERHSPVGRLVASPGDVNGDGFDDLLVGTGEGNATSAYLIYGRDDLPRTSKVDELIATSGVVRLTDVAGASSLAAPGDLDGDGFADLLIGVSSAAHQAGAVYLVYGDTRLPEEIALAKIADQGLGVVLNGEMREKSSLLPQSGLTGNALAVMDLFGDALPEIIIGARRLESPRGMDDAGKVYAVRGEDHAPAVHSLDAIEAGELAGAIITSEDRQSLGTSLAPAGDFDGDGIGDLLIGTSIFPSFPWDRIGTSVYLVRGRVASPRPLKIEKVVPAQAPLGGGNEITLFGAGFDEQTTVAIGGKSAAVARLETSARLVVQAPPGETLGSVDVVVRRGDESVELAAGVRYVTGFYPVINTTELAASRQGVEVAGGDTGLANSLALLDLDADGLSDVIASTTLGKAALIYGRRDPPAELDVRGLLSEGTPTEGVTLLGYGTGGASLDAIGDIDGDGHEDLAIGTSTAVIGLFGGERYEGAVGVEDLIAAGRGFEILHREKFPHERITRIGGGDHDGDGFDDLVVGWWTQSGPSRIYFVPGRRSWPDKVFLEDAATVESLEQEAFGAALAFIGDLDGDGGDELLAGAPGMFWRDDGHGYLFTGPAFRGQGDVSFLPDLEAQGRVRVLTSRQSKDSLGEAAVGLGDFNGDGRPDMALSAKAGAVEFAGESYVIFGGPELLGSPGAEPLSMRGLESRGEGVRCIGARAYDYAHRLAPAGDFNGDGLDDLLIVSNNTEIRSSKGNAFVVFGGPARTVDLHAIAGDGVRIAGAPRNFFGLRASGGGDFNGDGLGDIVLDSHTEGSDSDHRFYIVFGRRLEDATVATFLRGDANASQSIDLSDPVFLLNRLFSGGAAPPCEDAADANDDGKLDLADAVFALDHLFGGGKALPAPGPEVCGVDPTDDGLGCATGCP